MLTLNSEATISMRSQAVKTCQCACKAPTSSKTVSLSLDADVLEALRETGADWEVRFNSILRDWLQAQAITV